MTDLSKYHVRKLMILIYEGFSSYTYRAGHESLSSSADDCIEKAFVTRASMTRDDLGAVNVKLDRTITPPI